MSFRERIKKLEDIEGIKNLKHTYCYRVDNRDWDGVVELFAKESTADWGPYGSCKNRKEIEKYFHKTVPRAFRFFVHMVHNPIISVNKNRATGLWYLSESATSGRNAMWIQGKYEEEYIRENSEWKIKKVKLAPNYLTRFEKGWAKEKFYSASARGKRRK